MSTTMDARPIATNDTGSELPVTTAVYTVQFVMNEEEPVALADSHIKDFAAEIQAMMDRHGFTMALRYDSITFEVVSRIVIATTTPQESA